MKCVYMMKVLFSRTHQYILPPMSNHNENKVRKNIWFLTSLMSKWYTYIYMGAFSAHILWTILVSETMKFHLTSKWIPEVKFTISVTTIFEHMVAQQTKCNHWPKSCRVFFSRGDWGPPSSENFVNPPIRLLSPFLDRGLSLPPAEVHPQRFENFKYILVSNLTTFKLKSTLKSCISCLK